MPQMLPLLSADPIGDAKKAAEENQEDVDAANASAQQGEDMVPQISALPAPPAIPQPLLGQQGRRGWSSLAGEDRRSASSILDDIPNNPYVIPSLYDRSII